MCRTPIKLEEKQKIGEHRYWAVCNNRTVLYHQGLNHNIFMKIQMIAKRQNGVQKEGGTYCGRRFEPVLFSAQQGNNLSTGKTASEAINNLLVNIYGI